MRLKQVILNEQYRALRPGTFDFEPSGSSKRSQAQKMKSTLLIGANGAGKSTLLSLIHKFFFYLEREPAKHPVPLGLRYEITPHKRQTPVDVQIRVADGRTTVSVNDQPFRALTSWSRRRGTHPPPESAGNDKISFLELKDHLPRYVISSVFSLHGEFPQRATTYIGDRFVRTYDISNVYGRNHFSLPSLSRGIARLAKLFKGRDERVHRLMDLLGVTFGGQVLVRSRAPNEMQALYRAATTGKTFEEAYEKEQQEWMPATNSLIASEQKELVFFNDLRLTRSGKDICLGNMSSGEKMLFIRILSILALFDDNVLVLMEEPELHLDPSWTKQTASLLHSLFGDRRSHFLITTHSHSVINNFFPEEILHIQNGASAQGRFPTFLSSHAQIAGDFFHDWEKLSSAERHVHAALERGDRRELCDLLGKMGDSWLRLQVFRRLEAITSGERDEK